MSALEPYVPSDSAKYSNSEHRTYSRLMLLRNPLIAKHPVIESPHFKETRGRFRSVLVLHLLPRPGVLLIRTKLTDCPFRATVVRVVSCQLFSRDERSGGAVGENFEFRFPHPSRG